jgi:hypothetical protein
MTRSIVPTGSHDQTQKELRRRRGEERILEVVRAGEAKFSLVRYPAAAQEETAVAHGRVSLADDEHVRGETARRLAPDGISGAHQCEGPLFLPPEDA